MVVLIKYNILKKIEYNTSVLAYVDCAEAHTELKYPLSRHKFDTNNNEINKFTILLEIIYSNKAFHAHDCLSSRTNFFNKLIKIC